MQFTRKGEYQATLHLLTSNCLRSRTERYISDDGFDWTGLHAESETMSSGEEMLVRAAWDIWTAGREGVFDWSPVNLGKALWTLDDANMARLVEALLIYRGDTIRLDD